MQGIGNRLILLICCLVLAGSDQGATSAVIIGLLMAFITGCAGLYFDNKMLRLIPGIIFSVLTLRNPDFFFFMPVIFYEWLDFCCEFYTFKQKNRQISKEEITNNRRCIMTALLIIFTMYKSLTSTSINNILCIAALFVISIWMGIFTNKYTELKQKFIVTRDTSAELNLVLRNKNRYLIEKQDSEIYLATLRERNRIAREIHDNVGHMLSRSILQTGAVLTINKDENVQPFLEGIKDTLDQAMTSIRTSVHDLHDDAIDIKEAVRDITKDMTDYVVTIDYDMQNDVPRNVKYCIISVVKESVSNIIRHSNADKVNISIHEHPGFFRLLIQDNGTKCRKKNIMEEMENGNLGIGLSNIKDRVETLNGTLDINADNGFRIFISIPK